MTLDATERDRCRTSGFQVVPLHSTISSTIAAASRRQGSQQVEDVKQQQGNACWKEWLTKAWMGLKLVSLMGLTRIRT